MNTEPTSLIAAYIGWCDERAYRVFPTMYADDPNAAIGTFHALHIAANPDAAIDALAASGITLSTEADNAIRTLWNAEESAFAAYDDVLMRVPSAPLENTMMRPRLLTGNGLEVRGRRTPTVIGAWDDPTTDKAMNAPLSATGAELLARADLILAMANTPIPLIGTDAYSWHQVIVHKPYRIDAWVMRPEGAGASISGTARPRRSVLSRSFHYGPARHAAVSHIGAWPSAFGTDAFPYRIVKRYRTTQIVRAIDADGLPVVRTLPDAVVGHNRFGEPITRPRPTIAVTARKVLEGFAVVQHPKVPKVSVVKARTPRAQVVSIDAASDIPDRAVEMMVGCVSRKVAARYAWRATDGTLVRVSCEPTRKVIRVAVVKADGTRSNTTVRSAIATGAAIRNRIR